ncbi:MAG: hypothetical protein PWR13_1089 [Archaeoglobi archaeon]|nr:hypothetical protein [Archaeoglobi archaeon]
MDRWGFEPQASAMPMNQRGDGSIKLKKEVVERYFKYRRSRVSSERSIYWIEKPLMDYLKFSNFEVSRDKLMEFQNFYKSNYGFESQMKYHSNLRNFLEWLAKVTGNEEVRRMKEVLEAPVRPVRKFNRIIIREQDIHNLIKEVWKKDPSAYLKLKHISGILFASYTGQRPMSTVAKITVDELREAVSRFPPVLWIPENKDKEGFPHWVPIHPVLRRWLEVYIEYYDPSRENEEFRGIAFSYYSMRKLFDRLNVKAVHTGVKIAYSHLRKFFEQMCNNVLTVRLPDGRVVPAVHPGLRDYIMAHNTGSLDVQSYDGKLPEEIYEQYMMGWKKVRLVPRGIDLNKLERWVLREK